MAQDQKEKNKVKEADAERNGRGYKRAKETGEKKNKTKRVDEKREREKSEGHKT